MHPSIVRNDDVENYSISLSGGLGQFSNSIKLLEISDKLQNFLNTFTYSVSWSETNNNSNWLQNDYEKETLNFSLTKKVYFK